MEAVNPLIVIVGQTASGKSDLALYLAREFDGEIICADSRTVYRGMDIGTAKPSQSDQKQIKHYLLDIVEPDQKYNVAMFQKDANKAIEAVKKDGKLPIMVGGSGLYIDSVIYDYNFSYGQSETDPINPRHLKESNVKDRLSIRDNTLIIGLTVDSDDLNARIESRVNDMVKNGLIDEVKGLYEKYGADCSALNAPGYKAFKKYIDGEVELDEAKAEFARNDRLLAKRQKTWFKRNKSIQWVNNREEVVELVTTFLNKK